MVYKLYIRLYPWCLHSCATDFLRRLTALFGVMCGGAEPIPLTNSLQTYSICCVYVYTFTHFTHHQITQICIYGTEFLWIIHCLNLYRKLHIKIIIKLITLSTSHIVCSAINSHIIPCYASQWLSGVTMMDFQNVLKINATTPIALCMLFWSYAPWNHNCLSY